jgi:hypothetical protein
MEYLLIADRQISLILTIGKKAPRSAVVTGRKP